MSHNKVGYIAFVAHTVHAFLRDRNENPEIHDLVRLHQLRRFSKHVEIIKMKLVDLNLEIFS